MARNYSSPRYKNKSRPGRNPLAQDERRKLISARVAPQTYNYLMEQEIKIGLLIDQFVRKELLGFSASRLSGYQTQEKLINNSDERLYDRECETLDFDSENCLSEDAYDVITEQAAAF